MADNAPQDSATTPAEDVPAAAPAAAPAPRVERVKLKVEGKEIEEEVPFEKLVDAYRNAEPIRRTSYQRFEEAKKARDEAQRLVGTLKKDTRAALREAGIDPLEWAEQVIAEHLQAEQMSPAEREAASLKAELAKYKQSEEERAKAEEAAKAKQAEAEQLDRISDLIMETCQQPGMPPLGQGARGALVVKQLAHILEAAEDRGLELTPAELAKAYQEATSNDYVGQLSGLTGAALLKAIPPDVRKALREAELAEATGKKQAPEPSATAAPRPNRRKPMSAKELAAFHAQILEEGRK